MATPPSFIRQWSTTPASNGTAPNVVPYGFPEGQAPSSLNNCARQIMSDIRYFCEDAEWFCWNDTPSRASATTFKIATDVTSRYLANRRIKCYDATTLYGTVSSSSYGAPDTTVTVALDSGSLTASLTAVALSILSPTNTAIPQYLGDFTESVLAIGSAVALTTATSKTVTSISLTAGDWDVEAQLSVTGGATTAITQMTGGISLTDNTLPTIPATDGSVSKVLTTSGTSWIIATVGTPILPVSRCRINITSTTTVYLIANVSFTVDTCSAYGKINARRVR